MMKSNERQILEDIKSLLNPKPVDFFDPWRIKFFAPDVKPLQTWKPSKHAKKK